MKQFWRSVRAIPKLQIHTQKRSINMPFRKSPVYFQGILVSKFLSLTKSLTDTEATYPYKTYMQLINHF